MGKSDDAIEIRRAQRDDAAETFRLAQELATSSVPERDAFDRSLEQILSDDHHCLLVADSGEGLSGYLLGLVHPAFHANGYIAWVEEAIVDDAMRGSGLGTRLMTAFERWAVEQYDASYFALATRRAGDFYRTIGYHESAAYFKKVERG